MVDFVSPLDNTPFISSASSSGAAIAAADDDFEDACSICLEPFNSEDPHTVTNCKHEYHLQCILEWSQRSKECPICWQLLVLKDPASQELLAAVEDERNLRSQRNSHHIHDYNEINHDNSYADDSDFDECMMRHFAAAARRAHNVHRRGRQGSSGIDPPQLLFSARAGDLSDVQHMHPTSPEERRSSSYELSEADSPNSCMLTTINAQTPSSVVPGGTTMEPYSVDNRNGYIKPSQLSPESPRRLSSSEFLSFSESIESKFSAASSRYKESISKSTRGFKEKLLACNVSVKELGRGVQREMNAGIAGVTRMIERLDLTSKRKVSVPLSNSTGGTSNFSYKGKGKQESVITKSPSVNDGETASDMGSAASPYSTIPGHLEVPLVQSGN